MDHEDLLIGIAEVAIALTGFAGVVVVLGRRTAGPWPLADQYLLRSLIENGLLVVLAALLPFAILQHTEDPTIVWRVSSGLFGGAALIHVFFVQGRRTIRLRDHPDETPGDLFPVSWVVVATPLSLAIHGALLLNAAGAFFDGTFGPYLYGLLWDLLVGCVFFVRLIRFG